MVRINDLIPGIAYSLLQRGVGFYIYFLWSLIFHVVFGQEMESPSRGVPGETLPRRTCTAMCGGKIPGANISSSEPLALFYTEDVVSTTEVSYLRKIPKKSWRKRFLRCTDISPSKHKRNERLVINLRLMGGTWGKGLHWIHILHCW